MFVVEDNLSFGQCIPRGSGRKDLNCGSIHTSPDCIIVALWAAIFGHRYAYFNIRNVLIPIVTCLSLVLVYPYIRIFYLVHDITTIE